MDPLSAMLLALWIAGYFTKNVTQDLVYKARGEDPPSVRREQARRERRAERAADPGPGRRFWANAWADAVASAEERRTRLSARAAERRHAKWADADLDAAEAEAREINERVATRTETVYVCGGCDARITQSEVAGYALSGDPLCRTCRTTPQDAASPAGEARPAQDRPELGPDTFTSGEMIKAVEMLWGCEECGREMSNAGLNGYPLDVRVCRECETGIADDPSGQVCPDCGRYAAPGEKLIIFRRGGAFHSPCRAATNPDPDPDPDADADAVAGDPSGGTVTDITEWRSRGTIPPITKEDFVSGETTNLAAAMNYTQSMATQCGEGAVSCETSTATMRAGGVTGEPLLRLTHAQEALLKAQSDFMGAYEALARQVAVKDAYQATPEAGDKQFVTQD